MNTTAVGNDFEEQIAALLSVEIDKGRFWAKKRCCKIQRKKGYYSKDRGSKIVFDISVEISFEGAKDYSLLVLIECKKYTHAVPVDDVEEFVAKVSQVAGLNVKGIVATTSSFQVGALNYAKSKGVGVLRYFDPHNFKWVLKRSPSASHVTSSANDPSNILHGLIEQEYKSDCFDLYGQSNRRQTNSMWDFFDDLIASSTLSQLEISQLFNERGKTTGLVAFIGKNRIEVLAASMLRRILYIDGEVDLDAICDYESKRVGLKVIKNASSNVQSSSTRVLGEISFAPSVIRLYTGTSQQHGRARFTLAHELGHHILNHSKYMVREYFQESDLKLQSIPNLESSDIARMEWQANYFASCLLLPKFNFQKSFFEKLCQADIRDKGFGALYVDDQRGNVENFYTITNSLKAQYGVSRSAISIRLQGLGLLRDVRAEMARQ